MTVTVQRADLYAYAVQKLTADVAAFRQALADHATTVDVPAPTAHPLVEALARDDGTFVVPEDNPPETNVPAIPTEIINGILGRISALEAVTPPAGEFEALRTRVVPLETRVGAAEQTIGQQAATLDLHDAMLNDPSLADLRTAAMTAIKGAATGFAAGGDTAAAGGATQGASG
jgi:hypothetical protein